MLSSLSVMKWRRVPSALGPLKQLESIPSSYPRKV
jgi:hypothetical protein